MTETPDRGTGLEPARETDHAQGTQLIVASPPMGHSGWFRSHTPHYQRPSNRGRPPRPCTGAAALPHAEAGAHGHQKLGRIPDGGYPFLGRAKGRKNAQPNIGYSCRHHVVDDATGLAYSEILDDKAQETITGSRARAWEFFAAYGVHSEPAMTNNGPGYRSQLFNNLLDAQEVTHLYTRPHRPQTDGKVERFNRTLATKWAYAGFYPGEAAYPGWLHEYDQYRPHSSLDGRASAQAVHNLAGQYS